MAPWPPTSSRVVVYRDNATTIYVTAAITTATAPYPNYRDAAADRRLADIDHLLAELRELNRPFKGKYALRLPPVVALSRAEIVAWLGPTLQRYLTGPKPGG